MSDEVLPSWRPGPTRTAIVDFVAAVVVSVKDDWAQVYPDGEQAVETAEDRT